MMWVDREVMLQEVHIRCPAISHWVEFCHSNPARLYYGQHTLYSHQGVQLFFHAWYLDNGTIIGDSLVAGKVLELILEDGPPIGLRVNVDKTEIFGQRKTREVADVLNYAFIASRFQSASLQTKLLRHSDIVTSGPAFENALSAFNAKIKIDLLSNPSEAVATKLIKKLANIYFTRVSQTSQSTFSLSTRQIALWKSQMEDHTSDWLRVVPKVGLGQTINGRTYRCVLYYRLGIPLFSVPKPCPACFRVFAGDIYGDIVVSCAGIVGIKHQHNLVCNTLIDICFRTRISAGKEVDIGLGGGRDKPLRPTDMLLYSWDIGLDVFVDLTGSSPWDG
ncbi:hypothetical protein Tco_1085378 [Tanacetum coccineum]